MPESLGTRLRQRREEQNIPLVTIVQHTRIKQSLLESLEQDDVSHWPHGFVRRAFVRAYAIEVGLDPDVVVQEFLEAHPEPPGAWDEAPAPAPGEDAGRGPSGPPTRLRYLVGSALGSLFRPRPRPAPELPLPTLRPSAMSTGSAAVVEPVNGHEPVDPDFPAVARLCTEFGRTDNVRNVQPLLQEAARILDATGLVIWMWDEQDAELKPVLTYGYSDKVLGRLGAVRRDADNATAAAFRSAEASTVSGDRARGALVVPVLTSAGCAGVLAIELPHGRQHTKSARAVATILASLLGPLVTGLAMRRPGKPKPARAASTAPAPSAG